MKTVQRFIVGGALALATLHIIACNGGGGGDSGDDCGSPGRSGVTDCAGTSCGAGQYCKDESVGYECVVGCTSDENCGESERCIKCGDDGVGTCQSCSKSEDDVCHPGTCERDSTLDSSCAKEGAKGYDCPSDLDPPVSLGTCSNELGFWCCGGSAPANPCTRDNRFDSQFCFESPSAPYFYECEFDMTAPATCQSVMAYPGGYCCPDGG